MKKALILLVVGFLMGGVSPIKAKTNKSTTADVSGTYRGVMPCADCAGIITEAVLKDNKCVVKRMYIGKSTKVFESKGSYKLSSDGTEMTLKLDGEPEHYNKFHVSEDGLSKLDKHGQNLYTNLTNSYMLTKVKSDDDIRSIYWVLSELDGKRIDSKEPKLPFFILFNDGEFVGNSGCNSFVGVHDLSSADGQFRVSILSTSLKACPDAKYETRFMNVLDRAENYQVANGELILNQEGKPAFAKFRKVGFE